MFGFLGKKDALSIELYSPVTGKMIALENVPDQVFASKMMGEGAAFELEDGKVCAPCDGTITLIFPTLHAFGMKLKNGAELLIHIGLDTVSLNGKGFKKLIDQGANVKKGMPVIEVDINFMKENNIVLSTPMVITNISDYSIDIMDCEDVHSGNELVMTCTKK